MKSTSVKLVLGGLLSMVTLVPAFADTTNLKYEANVQNVLSLSIEAPNGDVLAKDGETAVLNFGNVDAFGLNSSANIDSIRVIKDAKLFSPGSITDNKSALYTIGSDVKAPTVYLRTRIQGGGGGEIEHSFQSKMDGMAVVFAPSDTPWQSANSISELDPNNKIRYFEPGAAPMSIAGPKGVYYDKPMLDNEKVGFDIALNVTPSATTGAKEATSTFRLLPI
jgi:hypothetical protein